MIKVHFVVALLLMRLTVLVKTSEPLHTTKATTTHNHNQTTNHPTTPTPHHSDGIHIFVNKFSDLSTPFIVCCWLLLATLAKIVFNSWETFADSIPESCLLIGLGVPIGKIRPT